MDAFKRLNKYFGRQTTIPNIWSNVYDSPLFVMRCEIGSWWPCKRFKSSSKKATLRYYIDYESLAYLLSHLYKMTCLVKIFPFRIDVVLDWDFVALSSLLLLRSLQIRSTHKIIFFVFNGCIYINTIFHILKCFCVT